MPFPPPGDLPDPGIEPSSPALQADFFTTELLEKPDKEMANIQNTWSSAARVSYLPHDAA